MAGTRKTRDTDILLAVETGWVNVKGESVLVQRGVTRAHAGSDIAKAYPQFFELIDVHFPVEQATAAPGERRGA